MTAAILLPGHWNSPIVVDGHVVEPEGDANGHELSGTLDRFSVGWDWRRIQTSVGRG